MKRLWQILAPVYPGEWNRYLCLTALIFLGKLNYDLIETLGFSKFLDHIGVHGLPWLYLALAFVTMLVIGSMTLVLKSLSRPQLMVGSYLLFALAFLLLRLMLQRSALTVAGYATLYLFVTMYQDVTNFTFLVIAGDYLDARQSKRLLPMISSFGIVGGIAGSFAAAWSVRLLARAGLRGEDLLYVAAAVVLLQVPVFWRLYRREPTGDQSQAEEESTAKGASGAVKTVFGMSILRAFTLGSVMVGLAAVCIDVAFAAAVKGAYAGDGLQVFYGYFKAYFKIASVFLQYFVSGALLRGLGIPGSMFIVPGVFLSIFGTFLVRFDVLTTTIAKVVSKITRTNLAKPAEKAFFSLFARDQRDQIQAFNKGVCKPVGEVFGALVLIAVVLAWPPVDGNLSDQGRQVVCAVGLGSALVYLAATVGLKARFRRDLRRLLRRESASIGLLRLLSRAPGRVARATLPWHSPEAVRPAHLAVMVRMALHKGLDPAAEADLLASVSKWPVEHRVALCEALPGLQRERAWGLLQCLVADRDREVQMAACRALARWPGAGIEVVWPEDPGADPRLAFWRKYLGGDRRAAILEGLRGEAREEALRALRMSPERALLEAADDVAAESLELAAEVGRLRVLAAPSRRSTAGVCLEMPAAPAIATLGPEYWAAAGACLEAWWRRGDDHWRSELAVHLTELEDERLRALAVDWLHTPVHRLASVLQDVIVASGVGHDWLEGAVDRSLAKIGCLDAVAAIAGGREDRVPAGRFLARWCGDQAGAEKRRLLRLLALLLPTAPLRELPLVLAPPRGAAVAPSRQRANALELLEEVVDRRLARRVTPLFEESASACGQAEAVAELVEDVLARNNAVGAFALVAWEQERTGVLGDGDAAQGSRARLRAVAAELLAEAADPGRTAMDALEKVAALDAMELFRELPSSTLLALAELARERCYEAGQPLFRQGDAGDRLCLILEGTVAVERHERDELRKVAELGRGDSLGEMALLEAVERSADARSVTGCRCLEIEAREFQALLWEEPAIAINATRVLSARLRRTSGELALLGDGLPPSREE